MDAEALALEVRNAGGQVAVVQADLRDPNAPARLVDDALRVFGRLDVVVSSASIMTRHAIAEVTPDEWDAVADVNLRAPFFLMQAAAPALSDGGVIIQMSDHLAFETGFPDLIPHQVTKAALTQLVRACAAAFAPRIRVNAVAPGLVLAPEGLSESARARFLTDVPLAREGSTDDVVHAIQFLVDAQYITGVVLPVDGGRHLRR